MQVFASEEIQHKDLSNACYTVYHLKNLKRGMATRAANFDNVIDWHIMGDQLVYACKPRGAIRVRILRGADGKACNFSEWTMFKLAKENGGRQSMPVFVQSFNNRDLFITACSKPPSSASSPDALYQDTILMRVSPHEKQRMKYRNYPSVREVWYMIGEDNLKFKIDLAGQMICKPALGQDCAYFVQNRSTDTGRNQPRFTKVSTADGTILFSKTIPEIREAGIIHDNGRSFTPVHSHDAKASHPGRAIEVPDHDKQMELTKSEDVAIWSDEELRMYIFCTDTGTLLYTYDRHSNSSVSMCLSEDGFWYGYQRPAPYGRYLTHYFCTFSKTQGRVLWGRPAFQYQKSGAYPIFGDQCVDVQVKHEHVKNPESMLRNSTLTMDPLTTFHICTMETRSYQREQVPKWLNWATMPRFNSNPVQEQQHYLLLEPRDKPYKRMKLKRGNRTLNASIHFGGRETESCQMVNGYLIYTNPRINQLILIDFFPEW